MHSREKLARLSTNPRWFLFLLISYPLLIIANGFSFEHGFLALPRFGEWFIEAAMPELKAMNPPIQKRAGYDGQFYAQMAIDPTLQHPALALGIDDVGYRGQRIGLSAIAYALGLGYPSMVVQIYSVLNFVFWCLLCALVLRWIGTETIEQRCVVLVIMLTAGSLVSISRALTDLPAATLGLVAVWFAKNSFMPAGSIAKWIVFSVSSLCKETGILSAAACLSVKNKSSFFRSCLACVVALIPLLLWTYYVKNYIGSGSDGSKNITFPLIGLAEKIKTVFYQAYTDFPSIHLIEFIAPLSIVVQAVYILWRFDWRSELWRFGVGFAVLSLCIAFPVWETQSAYSRVLLPLTLAFNLHLFSIRHMLTDKNFRWWFWLGNIGLLDRGLPMLLIWLAIEFWLHRRRSWSQTIASTV